MLFIYWNKSFSYFLFFSFSFFFFFSRTHIRISRNIYYYSIRILQSDGGQKTHMFDTCRYKSLARRRDANHLLSRVFSDFVEKFGSRETVNVEAHKSRGYLSLSLSPSLMRVIGSSMSIGWRRFLTGTSTDNEEIRPFRSPKYRVH